MLLPFISQTIYIIPCLASTSNYERNNSSSFPNQLKIRKKVKSKAEAGVAQNIPNVSLQPWSHQRDRVTKKYQIWERSVVKTMRLSMPFPMNHWNNYMQATTHDFRIPIRRAARFGAGWAFMKALIRWFACRGSKPASLMNAGLYMRMVGRWRIHAFVASDSRDFTWHAVVVTEAARKKNTTCRRDKTDSKNTRISLRDSTLRQILQKNVYKHKDSQTCISNVY